MEIEIRTVFDDWSELLVPFSQPGKATRVMSRHGVTFDIPNLTIVISNPKDTRIPVDYPLAQLVQDHIDRLHGDQRGESMIYKRLTSWKPTPRSRTCADQLELALEAIQRDQNTRVAVFSLWHPLEDTQDRHPVSPVAGSLRIVGGVLHVMFVSRSVDVWTGLIPELISLSKLAASLAARLQVEDVKLIYHTWSAHLYETDYIQRVVTRGH